MASQKEYTSGDIVSAFYRTEIKPIQRSWSTTVPIFEQKEGDRVSVHMVPCGCALVALARAEGVSVREGADLIQEYAEALGIDIQHAGGIVEGWDGVHNSFRELDPNPDPYWRGYVASNKAAMEIFKK